MNEKDYPKYMTIPQAARYGILTDSALRRRLAHGQLPGVYSGTRFYINVGQFLEILERESSMCGMDRGAASGGEVILK